MMFSFIHIYGTLTGTKRQKIWRFVSLFTSTCHHKNYFNIIIFRHLSINDCATKMHCQKKKRMNKDGIILSASRYDILIIITVVHTQHTTYVYVCVIMMNSSIYIMCLFIQFYSIQFSLSCMYIKVQEE